MSSLYLLSLCVLLVSTSPPTPAYLLPLLSLGLHFIFYPLPAAITYHGFGDDTPATCLHALFTRGMSRAPYSAACCGIGFAVWFVTDAAMAGTYHTFSVPTCLALPSFNLLTF